MNREHDHQMTTCPSLLDQNYCLSAHLQKKNSPLSVCLFMWTILVLGDPDQRRSRVLSLSGVSAICRLRQTCPSANSKVKHVKVHRLRCSLLFAQI